jgi:type II secretory ATPase GspE/PulE/Tfp pilus assembly ATPase PilB-like protein
MHRHFVDDTGDYAGKMLINKLFVNRTARYLESVATDEDIEVGTLVNYIITDAVDADASDIHIEPWESTLVVRVRLNGVLNELVHLPQELMDRISCRLKVMGNLSSYQPGVPQEGHVQASTDFGGVQLRLSFFPTVRGEKIVIRIFDPSNRSFNLANLGFEAEVYHSLKHLLSQPTGMILLTGPTGSGKTTAIYAALCHLVEKAGPTISLSTVEDPVEFSLPMISQSQINPAQEFTYPKALRSLMRQDPQVIMVGEIRDPETAAIAVQAGLTGHLVISTIHSGSTAGVFARLINMDIEPFLLASSITGILGLRLIRKNCYHCAEPYNPEPWLRKQVPPELFEKASFRRGAGCAECLQTGFVGRTALTELMVVNGAMREAVIQKQPVRALEQIAVENGMRTLWQNGLRRVMEGETPMSEILRVVAVE